MQPYTNIERQQSGQAGPLTVSVVICSYSLDRYEQLVASASSVLQQTAVPHQLVIVIDHNEFLRRRAEAELVGAQVVPNRFEKGLSGGRNTGVIVSTGDVVAFMDDDAIAEPTWLERLVAPYADPNVLGTGGHIEPRWLQPRPEWFPEEFQWVVGCSYRGLPRSMERIRNPIGCSMSFRRRALIESGLFRTGVGRVGANLAGCEETELSIRAAARWPGGHILYVPESRVHHLVPAARCTWTYFVKRCLGEGGSKAALAKLVGAHASSRAERRYALRTLPIGLARGVTDTLRGGRPGGLMRATAIVIGLTATAARARNALFTEVEP